MLDQLIITSLLEPLFLEVAVDVVAVATLAPPCSSLGWILVDDLDTAYVLNMLTVALESPFLVGIKKARSASTHYVMWSAEDLPRVRNYIC